MSIIIALTSTAKELTTSCICASKYHFNKLHTGNRFTTKMFISIHLKQWQEIGEVHRRMHTNNSLGSRNCPFHYHPSLRVTLNWSEQNQLTVDKPKRRKGRRNLYSTWGRERKDHKTGEGGWSVTPVSLQTGKRQRRVEPRNSAGHSAPQHATPCHHRTAPHLNS